MNNASRLFTRREDAAVMEGVSAWFWREDFWLPRGLNWSALAGTAATATPDPRHILLPIPAAALFCLLRVAFELWVARPLGRALGIPDSKPRGSRTWESTKALLARLRALPADCLTAGAPDANGNTLHPCPPPRPRQLRRPPKSTLDKFSECCYRFTYYSLIFAFGSATLWSKSWTWNTLDCWRGYPGQGLDSSIWWYYILQSSFYWALLASLFRDVRRSDWVMNGVHHVVTLGLLWFSWTGNFVRIGSLVLLVHDMVDPWLEGAKMARYAGWHGVGNACFAVFTVVWFLSRLCLYPLWILRSTLVEVPAELGPFPAYYLFNALLFALQVLHILWSFMIIKALHKAWKEGTQRFDNRTFMIIKALHTAWREGTQTEDCRSEDEESSDEEENAKED